MRNNESISFASKLQNKPELVQSCLLGNSLIYIYIGYVFAFCYSIADLEEQLEL